MKQIGGFLAACALVVGTAAAQPAANRPVNAASLAVEGMPNSGIAQGARFLITGKNLGPGEAVVGVVPYGKELGGTSVKVTVGGETVDAIMVSAAADQLVGILPSATPAGTGTLVVTSDGKAGPSVPIRVVRTAFGIYTQSQSGNGPANASADQLITLLNSARPSQAVSLTGTGLGAIAGDDADVPPSGDLEVAVEVLVGSKRANVTSKGRSGEPGMDKITFEVPPDVELGCYVPMTVRAAGTLSNFATLAIAAEGGLCSDPASFSSSDLEKLQNNNALSIGTISLSRTQISISVPQIGSVDMKTDTGSGAFVKYDASRLLASTRSLGGTAPIGLCAVFTYTGKDFVDPVRADPLDAGPALIVRGPRGEKQITKTETGFYSAKLGGGGISLPGLPPMGEPDYLEPGGYEINNGGGGADVGPFNIAFTIARSFAWTNQASISRVVRSNDLPITWSGGEPGNIVQMAGISAITNPDAAAMFLCLERAERGQFTVPAAVLSSLPPSAKAGQEPTGILMVGTSLFGDQSRFSASGLDLGLVTFSNMSMKQVDYQ